MRKKKKLLIFLKINLHDFFRKAFYLIVVLNLIYNIYVKHELLLYIVFLTVSFRQFAFTLLFFMIQ